MASIPHIYPFELEVSQAEDKDEALPSKPEADIPAVPALESSPETKATPTSPPVSSDSFEEESIRPVPRPRSLRDPPAERQDSWEGAPPTPGLRLRRQAALKFHDKFDSWRRDDLV